MTLLPEPEDFSTEDRSYNRTQRRIEKYRKEPHTHELIPNDVRDGSYYCWLCDRDADEIPGDDPIAMK